MATNMRKFYNVFQICETVSHKSKKPILSAKLSWSHYFEILKADNELEVSFYTRACFFIV